MVPGDLGIHVVGIPRPRQLVSAVFPRMKFAKCVGDTGHVSIVVVLAEGREQDDQENRHQEEADPAVSGIGRTSTAKIFNALRQFHKTTSYGY